MGPHDHLEAEDDGSSEVFSEGTISRCNSVEKMSTFTLLGDGQVEERFRVDRRKLEAMILGKWRFKMGAI